jgi:hypothetical protein
VDNRDRDALRWLDAARRPTPCDAQGHSGIEEMTMSSGLLTTRAVSDILFRVWDPIQISSNRRLADEYDEFVEPLLPLIAAGDSDGVYKLLLEAEAHMEVTTSEAHKHLVVTRLMARR